MSSGQVTEWDCFIPDDPYATDYGTTVTGYTVPHAWRWDSFNGKSRAECRTCGVSFRFVREAGDRINQETLTVFWRDRMMDDQPAC